MLYLDDLDVSKKVVLVRADLNVPLENGVIKDATRVTRSLPTLRHIIDNGGVCTVMSHLGRPKEHSPEFSLAPVASLLSELLGKPVKIIKQFGAEDSFSPDFVYLYENTRFYPGEDTNSPELAKLMGESCDIYVMDAFASSHREHASTFGVIDYAPISCSGFLFKEEIAAISELFHAPLRPVVAIIGGAKISSKIGLIDSLIDIVDVLVVVGGMANTFLKARGFEVGDSLCEDDQLEVARKIEVTAADKGVVTYLPQDFIIANKAQSITADYKALTEIEFGDIIYDVGKQTITALEAIISKANTILWNGPLGMFENKLYANGSLELAQIITRSDAKTIVGGGDTIRVLEEAGLIDKVSYASTGGGAFLDYLGNRKLPALEKLTRKDNVSSH